MTHLSLIASLMTEMHRMQPPIQPAEVQLDDMWIEFEKTLGEFKEEYIRTHSHAVARTNEYVEKMTDIKKLNLAINQSDPVLAESVLKLIQEYKKNSNIEELKEEASLWSGKAKAMEAILVNTNAKQYSKFTCPVCMDRLSDVCIDPCGHIMCTACLQRMNESRCPGCRVEIQKTLRMFPLA